MEKAVPPFASLSRDKAEETDMHNRAGGMG